MYYLSKGITVNFLIKISMVINMKENNKKALKETAATSVAGQPQTATELINKYGTYEIQPTADSDNDFPKIAQGLPKQKDRKVIDKD